MKDSQEHLYEEEEFQFLRSKQIVKDPVVSQDKLIEEYKSLSRSYGQLLNNIIVLTSISDRFQVKYKLANDQLQKQTEEIQQINLRLDADNRALKSDLKRLSKENLFNQVVDFKMFSEIYPSKKEAFQLLNELKWSTGYNCKRCENEKHCVGNSLMSRRCTKCRYDESVTAYTIFHKCKFPIQKALYMTILVFQQRDSISSYELSRKLELRQKTCWSFRKKILSKIEDLSIKDDRSMEAWSKIIVDA